MASQGSIPNKEMLSLAHAVSNTPPLTSKDRFWRFSGRDRRKVGWWESARAIFCVSCRPGKVPSSSSVLLYLGCAGINSLLVFIPLAWASHYGDWGHKTTFSLCFLAIIPLEILFDWGGEQMAMYLGKDLGDLVVVTLHKLKLLQSTITVSHNELISPGVVLLHLLLVPGTAFFTGGAKTGEQKLHRRRTQLNLTLLTVGVLALAILAAFFAATDINNKNGPEIATVLSDQVRDDFLRISRGFAIILLVIYVGSLFYLQHPLGASTPQPDDPEEGLCTEQGPKETKLELVDGVEFVREQDNIEEEWFGIILLPIASFSADATIAITYFIRQSLKSFFNDKPQRPERLAQARSIDMSIQFLLFWMPFVTLLGWWTNKPMPMLFGRLPLATALLSRTKNKTGADLFEVMLLFGACFLVNYVTADGKTNWAEGSILIAFYIMAGLSAWYYTGQSEVRIMNACTSVATALLEGVEDSH
ncbi:hypothetical protein EDB86DRAFT_3247934 [Lactarius hatsudake]|nr:hypothetical protein EDB86DRAFT_3247934 [Lactarius hatsudake]